MLLSRRATPVVYIIYVQIHYIGFRIILFLTTGAISFPSAGDFSIFPPPSLPSPPPPNTVSLHFTTGGAVFIFYNLFSLASRRVAAALPPRALQSPAALRSRHGRARATVDWCPVISQRLSRANPPRRPTDNRPTDRPTDEDDCDCDALLRPRGPLRRLFLLLLLLFYPRNRPK